MVELASRWPTQAFRRRSALTKDACGSADLTRALSSRTAVSHLSGSMASDLTNGSSAESQVRQARVEYGAPRAGLGGSKPQGRGSDGTADHMRRVREAESRPVVPATIGAAGRPPPTTAGPRASMRPRGHPRLRLRGPPPSDIGAHHKVRCRMLRLRSPAGVRIISSRIGPRSGQVEPGQTPQKCIRFTLRISVWGGMADGGHRCGLLGWTSPRQRSLATSRSRSNSMPNGSSRPTTRPARPAGAPWGPAVAATDHAGPVFGFRWRPRGIEDAAYAWDVTLRPKRVAVSGGSV